MSQAKAEPLTREIGARSKGGGRAPAPAYHCHPPQCLSPSRTSFICQRSSPPNSESFTFFLRLASCLCLSVQTHTHRHEKRCRENVKNRKNANRGGREGERHGGGGGRTTGEKGMKGSGGARLCPACPTIVTVLSKRSPSKCLKLSKFQNVTPFSFPLC